MTDILIWGASGGIGSALVDVCKNKGWRVFAAARDEARIPATADFTYPFEAGDPASFDTVIRLAAQQTDGFDLMIYAAGGLRANPLDKLSAEDWQATIDANLNGAFLAAHASLDLMKKDGQMMFLGAYVHKITLPRMGAYTAAKAALESFVEILQKENRKMKINLVRLPAVRTPFWEHVPFNLPDYALDPHEVAERVVSHHGASGTLEL